MIFSAISSTEAVGTAVDLKDLGLVIIAAFLEGPQETESNTKINIEPKYLVNMGKVCLEFLRI